LWLKLNGCCGVVVCWVCLLLISSSIWLLELVRECIDLVSIELECVSRKVMNFVIVMLRLVVKVVMIVLVLLFDVMLVSFLR